MSKPPMPSLKIQELDLPYGVLTPFKGRLFSGTPNRGKPRSVPAEAWCELVLEAAQSSWKKHLAIPRSFWPKEKTLTWLSEKTQHHFQCIHVFDTFHSVIDHAEVADSLRKKKKNLSLGEDVLIISANKKISGFVPAALTMLLDPQVHIAKVLYPITVGSGYDLTPFQLGYLHGLSDNLRPEWQ